MGVEEVSIGVLMALGVVFLIGVLTGHVLLV